MLGSGATATLAFAIGAFQDGIQQQQPSRLEQTATAYDHNAVCFLLVDDGSGSPAYLSLPHAAVQAKRVADPAQPAGGHPSFQVYGYTREEQGQALTRMPSGSSRGAIRGAAGGYCNYTVHQGSVDVEVFLPGVMTLHISSSKGVPSASLPWAPRPGASPEGWVSPFVRLHYHVHSMATPVHVNLTWLPAARLQSLVARQQLQHEAGPGVKEPGSAGSTLPGGSTNRLLRGLQQDQPAQQTGSSFEEPHQLGSGMGKQRAAAGRGRGAPADPHTPVHRPVDLGGAALLHMEKNWGGGFPYRWVWAQGHAAMQHGQVAFVLAGGDLPTALSPLPVRQYVFSARCQPQGACPLDVQVDPLDPAVGFEEHIHGCLGLLNVKMYTATHIVTVGIRAPPDSFVELPCPSRAGAFEPNSVESFQASASIRILQRPFPFAAEASCTLLADVEVPRAALEFGGDFMCKWA